ncbi:hypothetical protein R5H32_06030 [Defluviimonas sp. D31]|uniref:hypothetical protein n=1 Tax=Defluviimonas sp. D31 TaxID=3083253 RepID=UPI00296F91CD|nr:hypothetical protein [Defluviimonas sp. D31]MDW4548905.1 hypothetical protein [Defluviimonas sp. D31]
MAGPRQTGAPGRESGALHLDEILLRVGKLNYTWSNTESLLIHLIAGLARVDKDTALIIFLTLNTTRARLDLVGRLAKMERTPVAERNDVLDVTERFSRISALRNKYNHCIYSFDANGGSPKTILMRISDRKDAIRYGKTDPINSAELETIDAAIETIADLNREIWRLAQRHGYPI